jgi:hypothetical protein
MQIDTIGEMVDFRSLSEGQLFFTHLEGRDPTFAMRTLFADSHGVSIAGAVVSFSHEAHPSTPAPLILDTGLFINKSVLLLNKAVFRIPADPLKLRTGTPSLSRSGTVMFGSNGALFIRCYRHQGFLDVDVNSGGAETSRNHPEQMWTDEWRIVIEGPDRNEQVLVQSTPQKAAAA